MEVCSGGGGGGGGGGDGGGAGGGGGGESRDNGPDSPSDLICAPSVSFRILSMLFIYALSIMINSCNVLFHGLSGFYHPRNFKFIPHKYLTMF